MSQCLNGLTLPSVPTVNDQQGRIATQVEAQVLLVGRNQNDDIRRFPSPRHQAHVCDVGLAEERVIDQQRCAESLALARQIECRRTRDLEYAGPIRYSQRQNREPGNR